MLYQIKKYPVRHPLLRNYIKFFWGLDAGHMQLNHKVIPQRNINLRFNLSETPQYLFANGSEQKLEEVFFSGLHNRFGDYRLKMNGKINLLGVCFTPDGFYPFVKIPISEFKNQLMGAMEVGIKEANTINSRLKEAPDTATRLDILEKGLVLMLGNGNLLPENFRNIFNTLEHGGNTIQLSEFCHRNNIGIRRLERMYNKYVGASASTYSTLNRFHIGMNQLLHNGYSKLSDLAYDNGYFDQMHFIKDFKRYAGVTPKAFVHQNNSILQIGKFS